MGEAKIKQVNNFTQSLRFSDEEIGVIKSFFADNDIALIAVRKVFYQDKLNEVETNIVKGFTKDILDIIKRQMLPTLNCDTPIQIISKVKDWWSSFDFMNLPMEKIAIDVQSRNIIIKYLTQQFSFLSNEQTGQEISFADLTYGDNKNLQQGIIELNARGSIIKNVEDMLINFKMFAGEKKETAEQARERLFKNSSK